MLTIIIKTILCTSIFIAVYHLFLEREKMYGFNRAYLVGTLILSHVIPFITITVPVSETKGTPQLIIEEITQQTAFIQPGQESFDWMGIVWIIYGMVTIFLLIKSILAISRILGIDGERSSYQNYTIVLTEKDISPFSFWNTIYLGKNHLKDGMVDSRIFLHEKSHIDQKHSIDLILISIMQAFTWFNPVLILYKKAMVANHEFLADEAVLNNDFNLQEYQNLILEEILNSQELPYTHSFNFNNTKKRFIMMKAKRTRFSTVRKAAAITAIIAAIAFISEKTYAHTPINQEGKANLMTVSTNKDNENGALLEMPEIQKANLATNTPVENLEEKVTTQPTELKKESLKAVSDTISPKRTTENKEGKSTNTNINEPVDKEEIPAEYPEGRMSLRAKVAKNLDTSVINPMSGTITATAYVHINENGKTTNVTVSGNDESFNKELLKTVTAISNETTWKPATKDGKAIASILKVPASMTFNRP